jgi:hypothetical protein
MDALDTIHTVGTSNAPSPTGTTTIIRPIPNGFFVEFGADQTFEIIEGSVECGAKIKGLGKVSTEIIENLLAKNIKTSAKIKIE